MIYDISQPISESMSVYAGDPEVTVETLSDVSSGASYGLTRIEMGSHTGTHVDAPSHLLKGGGTIDDIALDILIGPCFVALSTSDMKISIRQLEIMQVPVDTVRLLIATKQAEGHLSYETAYSLIESGVKLVGVDSPSVDSPDSTDLRVHRALLEAGTVIVENLDLDEIEPGCYWLACLPLRIAGCDGAPARVVLMDTAPDPMNEGVNRG